jgi:hypothetical protein
MLIRVEMGSLSQARDGDQMLSRLRDRHRETDIEKEDEIWVAHRPYPDEHSVDCRPRLRVAAVPFIRNVMPPAE